MPNPVGGADPGSAPAGDAAKLDFALKFEGDELMPVSPRKIVRSLLLLAFSGQVMPTSGPPFNASLAGTLRRGPDTISF